MLFNDRRKSDKSSLYRQVSKKNKPVPGPTWDFSQNKSNNVTSKMESALGWESGSGVSFKKSNNVIGSGPDAGPHQPVARGYSKKNARVVKPQPKGAQRTYNKVGK
jgi:hypothetical protein